MKRSFSVWGIRAGMVVVWTMLLYGALLSPRLVTYFYPERSITVLAWPSGLTADFIEPFVRETGIKVHILYFESYDEVLVKMRSQVADHDLVMLADYIVPPIIQEKLIKPLDWNRLNVSRSNLYAELINHSFDLDNQYTIPWSWTIFGIAYDINQSDFEKQIASWQLVFDPHKKHVGMIDDVREISSIAALYLWKQPPSMLDNGQWQQLEQLLYDQKQYVVLYSDMRPDYLLLSGTCALLVTNSSEVSRAITQHASLRFDVPQEGSFWVIDSFAIPASTSKDSLVYEFLSYIYRQSIVASYVRRLGFSPAVVLNEDDLTGVLYKKPSDAPLYKCHFFDHRISDQRLNDVWIRLKA